MRILVLVLLFCGWLALPTRASACVEARGGTIAAWCDGRLFVSFDDGATWTVRLTQVVDAAVSPDGAVVAITQEDPTLVRVIERASDARHTVPIDVHVLAAAQGVIYAVGLDPSAPPFDHYRVVAIRAGSVRQLGAVSSPGVIEHAQATAHGLTLYLTDHLSCWGIVAFYREVIAPRPARVATIYGTSELCTNGQQGACPPFVVQIASGAHGAAYALRSHPGDYERVDLALLRPRNRFEVTTVHAASGADLVVAHDGRTTIAVLEGQLYELSGARARPLGEAPSVRGLAVDALGRAIAWSDDARAIVRHSPETRAWETLFAIPAT